MNTEARLPPGVCRERPRAGMIAGTALLALVPITATSAPQDARPVESRVADVSLTDLNLSTQEGMRAAHDRLEAMARRVCGKQAENAGAPALPNFAACVANTLGNALRQVNALTLDNRAVRNSVTRAASVTLADLDLSTPEGFETARQRLRTSAERVCSELARSSELLYQPSYTACVDDSLRGALAQVRALAAAREPRTAQRTAP
jgi:UrcA family protein